MQIPDAIIEKAALAIGEKDEADCTVNEWAIYCDEARKAVEAVVSDIVAARDQQTIARLDLIAHLCIEATTSPVGGSLAMVQREIVLKLKNELPLLPGLFGEQGEEPS